VLQAEPELAKLVSKDGITPLWWLPDDEAKALEIVDLFISYGADPSMRSREGRTAADWALKRGMREVADRLTTAAATQPTPENEVAPEGRGPKLEYYENLARDLLVAYESGDPPAMQRLFDHYGRSLMWNELRDAVQGLLRSVPDSELPADGMYEGYFALPHARLLIARQAGFANWASFAQALEGRF
jgi:hypothetical protein